MQLATCSYSEYRPEMGVPVRITLGQPQFKVPFYDGKRQVPEAAPKRSYFNASDEIFEQEFYKQIDNHGVANFQKQFDAIYRSVGSPPNTPLVLLCFEKFGTKTCESATHRDKVEQLMCHRRMFAAWWEKETGEKIPELGSRARIDHKTPQEEAETLW